MRCARLLLCGVSAGIWMSAMSLPALAQGSGGACNEAMPRLLLQAPARVRWGAPRVDYWLRVVDSLMVVRLGIRPWGGAEAELGELGLLGASGDTGVAQERSRHPAFLWQDLAGRAVDSTQRQDLASALSWRLTDDGGRGEAAFWIYWRSDLPRGAAAWLLGDATASPRARLRAYFLMRSGEPEAPATDVADGALRTICQVGLWVEAFAAAGKIEARDWFGGGLLAAGIGTDATQLLTVLVRWLDAHWTDLASSSICHSWDECFGRESRMRAVIREILRSRW